MNTVKQLINVAPAPVDSPPRPTLVLAEIEGLKLVVVTLPGPVAVDRVLVDALETRLAVGVAERTITCLHLSIARTLL